MFSSGNSMATGARSQYRAKVSALLLCNRLNTIVPRKCARVVSSHVVNLVASVTLGFDLDMQLLQRDMQFSGCFVKSSFQGLSIKMRDLNCVFVVFGKGCKINIAGMTAASDIDAVARRLLIFYEYQIKDAVPLVIGDGSDDDDDALSQVDSMATTESDED